MKRQLRGTVAFAVCGSFCTLGAAVAQAEQLVRQGWELLPVMSYAASGLNTRFGRADEWKARLETLTGHRVLDNLQDVEPLGPRQLARARKFLCGRGALMAFFAFLPTIGEAIAIVLGLMRSNVWLTGGAMLAGKTARYIVILATFQGALSLF